jgi:DNA-binding NarL/FixJ family response regulator
MDSSYNLGLVALSVVISITASYAALDLAGRVTSAVGPIILTTGFSRLMTHEQAVALGIRGLLRKPVAAAILIDGVHRALRPRELVPPALAV